MSEENKWKVVYWSNGRDQGTIEEWLDSLTNEQFESVAKEIKLLELCCNMLKLPHSRSLKKGLCELRERKYGFRIYYTFLRNKIIILLNAGNKKTQDKDIDLARRRFEEVIRDEGRAYESKKFSTVS